MSCLRVEGSGTLRLTEVPGCAQKASGQVGEEDDSVYSASVPSQLIPSGAERLPSEEPFRETEDAGQLPQERKGLSFASSLLPSSSSAIPPSCASRPPLTAPVHRFAKDADISKLPLSRIHFRPVRASDYTQLRQLHEELFPFKYEHTFYDFVCKGECFSLAAVVLKRDLEGLPRLATPCAQPRLTPARHPPSSSPRDRAFSQDTCLSGVSERARNTTILSGDKQSDPCASIAETYPTPEKSASSVAHGKAGQEPLSDELDRWGNACTLARNPHQCLAPGVLNAGARVGRGRGDRGSCATTQRPPTLPSNSSAQQPSESFIRHGNPSFTSGSCVQDDSGDYVVQENFGHMNAPKGDGCADEDAGESAVIPALLEKGQNDDRCSAEEFLVGIITVSLKSAYFRSHDVDCVRKWYRMRRESLQLAGSACAPGPVAGPRSTRQIPTCCKHALIRDAAEHQVHQPHAEKCGQKKMPASSGAHVPSVRATRFYSNVANHHYGDCSASGMCHVGEECSEKRTKLTSDLVEATRSGVLTMTSAVCHGSEDATDVSHPVSITAEEACALTFPNLQADESVSDLAYILTLGVAEEFRQKGLAQELIQRTLAYFACPCVNKLPTRSVFLHVVEYNHAALHFYEKQKFKAIEFSKDFYHIYGSVHGSFLYAYNLAELEGRCECSIAADAKQPHGISGVKALANGHIQDGVQWGLSGMQNAFRKVGETLGNLWNSSARAGGIEFVDDSSGTSYGAEGKGQGENNRKTSGE
ncbi:acetyltransferase, GNAT family protein [Toxoplasma gondii RUB]|uniref:N-alpha-acetyltransferase 60 n=1 Tax=Toxoplasma gondii RUB TaxID=935652 RepID=A0A086M8W1_TOXGO|nr:acetyltransferase, GNAT family protein [Toxoplasma gondii RUB]